MVMTLALVPHLPPPSKAHKLHLWVGVLSPAAAPVLSWKVNDAAATPRTLRPLVPVLTGGFAGAGNPRVFTGFYEFCGLAPDADYRIELTAGAERIVRSVRTLPEGVPFGPQDRLNVLLLSCFHRLEDKTGLAGKVLSQLRVRPDMTLFMGDQVYLDLPTLKNFSEKKAWLGNKFQDDYLDNWFGGRLASPDVRRAPAGFPEILALAPAAFLPDDHEYWNNYPYSSSFIQNTWKEAGRQDWKEAAELTYRGFQQTGAVPFGDPRIIDIKPLSIFLLDTRSQRHPSSRKNPGDLLGKKGRKALAAWAKTLVASAAAATPIYGMLVTGQSLFRSAVGAARGQIADFEFPDYENDYRFMVGELDRVARAGLPVICATGDVHWGRILRANDTGGQTAPVFEVISSPTSLVSTVGADEASRVWDAVRGLFGSRNAWPRHSDPEQPPPRFGNVGQYATEVMSVSGGKRASMRGNHAIMLRFSRAGRGLDVEATCYPLHKDDAINSAEQWSARLALRPTK